MSKEKNLKPFKKGVSGNPGGRPKWKHITELLKNEHNQDKLVEVVNVIYKEALEGNMRAVEFIADRLEGKVAHKVSVEQNNKPEQIFEFVDMRDSVALLDEDEDLPILDKPAPRKSTK